jgi:hypothetical protein
MPGLDGFGALESIRGLQLRKRPKVVAVSANAFEDARTRSLAQGCDAFLTKPVDFDQLRDTLGSLLGLEWELANIPGPRAEMGAAASDLPPERLGRLYELAREGDVMALESELEGLEAEPKHAAFAAQLRMFIARVDLRGAERWLEPLIHIARGSVRASLDPTGKVLQP